MKKLLLLSLLFVGCVPTTNEGQTTSRTFNKTYYVLCHRGVEYISRSYGESSFIVAVDKNKNPIECK